MKRDVGRTTRDLRRHNRTSVLTRLYLHGPASRFDLMRATGLSSATVSNVVTDLVADGMVAEAGLLDSDGGRPRTLLEVRPGYAQVVGVDIGETHVQVGLFDWTLDTVATATYPMDEGRPDPAVLAGLVTAGIEEVTAKAGADPAALLGVGIGVPGTVLPDGLVHAPTLGWSGVPFGALLRPHIAAPLHLDNCARTLGQAEMWRGAGRGAERAIVALLAVGVGAAVATGSPGGVTSTTSEWGHTVVEAGGAACRCGSHGCLEAYVGADAILEHYERAPGARDLGASRHRAAGRRPGRRRGPSRRRRRHRGLDRGVPRHRHRQPHQPAQPRPRDPLRLGQPRDGPHDDARRPRRDAPPRPRLHGGRHGPGTRPPGPGGGGPRRGDPPRPRPPDVGGARAGLGPVASPAAGADPP